MSVIELLATLKEKDVQLSVKGDQLVVRGRKQSLSEPAVLALLREHKAALIALIQAGEYDDSKAGEIDIPANVIALGCRHITPQMLPLVTLDQSAIDRIVATVPGGAANVQDIYPLAPLQEGILYHHLTATQGDPYVLQAHFSIARQERLTDFVDALQSVIDRHDILRTAIVREGLQEAVQVVWREAQLGVKDISADLAEGDVMAQLQARFDPRHYRLDVSQAPLLLLVVAEDPANQRWAAMLLFHHMALDHAALMVVQSEMQAWLMGQSGQLQPAAPYRDYVVRTRQAGQRQADETFFREMLGDVEEPTLPFGQQDVLGDGSAIEESHLTLASDLSRRLRVQARQLGVSAASIFHLAWAQVLGGVSGREDVVFGTVMLGRMQAGESMTRALGMFINTLPLRVGVGAQSVRDGVKSTHAGLSSLLSHEYASLALAQRCSGVAAPAPLFSALLNYRHSASAAQVPAAEVSLAWDGMEALGAEERTNYPLILSVDDFSDDFALSVQATALIGAQRIGDYMQAAVESLVTALESAPEVMLNDLSFLPESERERVLLSFNDTDRDYPREQPIHALFEAQAEARPDAPAAVQGEQVLTYRELDSKAGRLARHLLDLGLQAGQTVAILLPRSLDLLVSQLAVLKCAAVYLPLDVNAPAERQQFMIEDSHAVLALTHRHEALAPGVRRVDLDSVDLPEPAAHYGQRPASSEAPAYIMYTSGSTGTPKGVLVPHRAISRLVINNGYADFNEQDRVAFASNPAFDASTLEVWAPLLNGGCVVVVEQDVLLSQERLHGLLLEQAVNVLWMTAGLFHQYADRLMDVFAQLRYLIVGGDVLDPAVIARVLKDGAPAHLLNGYGPTEATTFSTTYEIKAGGEGSVPIGRPLGNTRVYILDAQQRPVPQGVTGELYIGGLGVAIGYLNRPDLTAEKFLLDPFSQDAQALMYRTGDLGRFREDGNIEYLGRNDGQVKIRGFRIEPGEIEARLAQHAAVKEATVLVREDVPGEKRLVAYFTLHPTDDSTDIEALRAHLQSRLPDYMVPAAYVRLDALPLTPNGKLDRKALPVPDQASIITRGYEAPLGDTEITLARLWRQVLNVERVGRHDHFFELGGHSLLAVNLIEQMRQVGLSADVRVLFGQPTLAALAAAVGGGNEIEVPANGITPDCERITPAMLPLATLTQAAIDRIVTTVPGGVHNVQDIYPLAPLQEGILYHHVSAQQGDPYVLQALFAFQDEVRLEAFAQALQGVIDRHDILRTSIMWEGLEQPIQVVWRKALLSVERLQLDASDADAVAQLHARYDSRHHRLDIRQAPLMCLRYAHDPVNQRWVAMLLFHHIALDHTALEVVQQEMQAHLLGQAGQLAAALPYRNYVAQARLGVSEQEHEAFFREMLGDVDEPTLPLGLQQVQGDGRGIEEAKLEVDAALSRRLRAQARQLGVSAASLHHLAWAQVLGRLSAREDVVFGTVLMGRMQGGEGADRVLGMFINTLPLRVSLDEQGARAGVKTIHGRLTALLGHEHASLALAQRCSRVAAPAPLFSALLNYRHSATGSASAEAMSAWQGMEILSNEERTNYPLTLSVDDLGDGFMLSALVVQGIGAARICAYMHTALESLVRALEHVPQTPLNRLEILPESERHQLLVDFNATKRVYPHEQTVLALFEAQAAHLPQAIAVVHGQRQVTYAQLNEQANRLAHHLIGLGVQPDDCVAILLPRSIELLASQLAILKCAAAYVPLDRNASLERQGFMLDDCQAKCLLTFSTEAVPEGMCRIDLDTLDSQGPLHNPALAQSSESIAYIMYTSGSTGTPKGVLVPHRAINRLVINNGYADFNEHDRIAFASNPAFDASTMDVWGALLNGGQVVVIDHETLLEPARFAQVLEDSGVTVLFVTTAIFNQYVQLIPQAIGGLRILLCGGERADVASFRRLLELAPSLRLVHCYGPTETTTYATTLEVKAVAADAECVPIGGPIGNTQVYVLDARQQLAPLGVVGEMYIGGKGVAKGYLNRPDLTAEKFIANPFSHEPDALLYRTGDLGRWLPDGSLECLGRNDDQVKIRGFRIELGEIEAKLVACEGVRDAVVLVRADETGEKRLVAYVIAQPQVTLGVAGLREQLSATLSDYMVPAAFVMLPAFPLTLNGKVDRKALPAPDAEAYASQAYEAPQGEIEQALADLWAELLKVERVGRHDNFFELGGHSLLAMRLIERMRQVELSVDVRVLFSQPTLQALAAAVGGHRDVVVPACAVVEGCERITPDMLPLAVLSQEAIDRIVASVPGGARNVQEIYPLAPLQEGILYHHLTAEMGDPYVLQTLFGFDSRARLDDFAQALQGVIDRHDILRTSMVWENLDEPMQVVWRQARLSVDELDSDPSGGDAVARLYERFDARHYRLDVRQAPMLRLAIAEDVANQRWVAMLLFHHMVLDHTGLEVLEREMQAQLLGKVHELGESVPYRNYVAQARLGVDQQAHEAFFRDMLGDVDEPTLPFGLRDVQGDGNGVEEVKLAVEAGLCRRLRTQARQLGVSAASLMHLAWAHVLGRVSGRDDVVFGTVLLGRMQAGDGADRALGMFINTLPLRVSLAGQGVYAAVKATHKRLSGLLGHEHAPLALAQRCSGVVAPTPLFSSMLNYRHCGVEVTAQALTAWQGIESIGGEERTNYPLVLAVDDEGEGFSLVVQALVGTGAQRIGEYVQTTLESLVSALEQAPDTPQQALTSLPAAERLHLLETLNSTAVDYPQGLTLHGLFEARVAACPDAVAVVSGEAELSYSQLNARANQVAHRLLELGIRPDDRVAICADRSLDMVAGLLGILKAGAAYVPLDPDYPHERLAYMLENSAPRVVLTQRALQASLPATQARTLLLDEAQGFSMQPTDNPQVEGLHAHHLAYVIYTSGSTGLPKGVMNEHGAVVNRLLWMQDEYALSATDAVLQKTPFSFDVSVWEFFWPLFSGARLVMARPGGHRDPAYLREVIQAQGITTLHFVPSMLDVFLAHGEAGQCEGLVRVMCSGEALPGHLVRRFKAQLPHTGLYNLYGPTEAAVDVTAWDCAGTDTPDSTPIGKPIANTRIYLLDAHQQPVPLGVAGEIYIGGVQVARGYLNRPELTVERFLRDPFSDAANARMYRTGDLGRYLPDGNIEYLGRNDDQVKIRGFRIELGEIEARLAQHDAVKEAVVLAREDVPGEKRLVAYFTTHSVDEMADIETLRTHLLEQLPEYMVPAAYMRLDALPLTPNGKLDRKALPAPDHSAVIVREYEAPQGEVEASIARIWEDLLKLEQVGRHDNFFELGGHSLLAVKMIERMRQVDLSVDVRVLFGQPTLAALAAAVGGYREVVVPANGIPAGCTRITPDMLPLADLTQEEIERIVAAVPGGVSNVQDIYALAPLQEGILYHHLTAAEGDPYLQQVLFGFDSFTRLEDFAHALQAVITRHDILRTGVLWEGLSEPMQVVWRDAPLSVESVALDPTQGDIATQLHQRFDPRFYRLDIRQAPMMRIVYGQDPANQRWVGMLLFHHLVDDVTSLAVLSAEIEAHMLGQAQRLSASVPYRNFVAQARLGVSREEHETFFRDMLGDIDEPTLPFDLQDVQGDGSGIEEVRQDIAADLSQRLRAQARQLGVSAASVYHLVWAQVLGKVSGKDDVVFGTVLVGRMQGGEGADRALGMFINTLPLRVSVGQTGVRAGVKATHERLTALLGHEHAALALAQRCSGVQAPTPLFSALLNYRHTATTVSSEALSAWNGIQVLSGEERTNYPLMLSVDDQGEAFSFTVMTPARIGAQRLCGYVQHTLENLVRMLEQTPDLPLQQLSILPVSEREQLLVTFNATEADYPQQQTIHGLFEDQVQRTPDAVAVIRGEQRLSYGELNERANRLAHYLRKQGVEPDSRVAICVERGIDMVVGLLAILKAGGGYVPLDPAYPLDRIAYMLDDSAPAAVLAQTETLELLAEASMPVINLDSGLWQDESVQNPDVAELTSSHLAYVIYTSGSTGLPKGVMIEHRNTVNFLTWAHRSFDAQTLSKTLFSTSLNFDLAVYECFAPLTSGGSIEVVTNVLELQQGEHDITLINTVPSALKALLESGGVGEGVDTVNVAGEALKRSLVETLFEQTQVKRLCNLYGPSETTTYSSWVSMAREDGFAAHIGKPVANTQFYLLDEHGQPVPLGVPGEIYIGGAGVARGYLNRDDLTAERFLKDSFSTASNARMYKTGDLGRYLPDGNIEYLGRNDDQVKIRGFRIELGEIEAKLAQATNIKETVVLAREDVPGDKRLVAYFTQHSPDEAVDIETLRMHLQAQLPAYMVPAAYMRLDALPLTPNGKLDRKALPAPDSNAYTTRLYETPVGDMEVKLAALWAELLKVERVGRHDHFFELGGHSLLAVTLIERMRKDGMEADIRVLFGQPTLAQVAAAVGQVRHIDVPMTKIPALTRKRSI
ncbi:amino acid adenylation domain-containing protein [Pseudomonas brassicacearum]|uniref:non-ribosomal peptide synthetase n=2 Tax=Pseudomonas TaxID=286 RepID=UPI0024BB8C8F|nr:non-ribosomal peptide synthetase [Pseudomonas brassicacearum]WHS56692.1 amino acid adenylation domain-containing protein [Pseudomonas brassicacearum]